MFSLTLFTSLGDAETNKRMDFETFKDFEEFLSGAYEMEYEQKKDAPLISPAIFDDTTKPRSNENVSHWGGWCAFDVDDWTGGGIVEHFEEKLNGYKFILYSTASSTQEKPKFRVVIPTSNNVSDIRIRAFWYGMNRFLGTVGDKQVKDYTRLYYVPGSYKSSNNNFLHISDGQAFVNYIEIIHKNPIPENIGFIDKFPKEIQDAVIVNTRRKLLKGRPDLHWNSYTNCPFWPRRTADYYRGLAPDSGRYFTMYRIMVAIAFSALKQRYPINEMEISALCREFDLDSGARYKDRPFEREARRSIEYACKKA